MKYEQKNKDFIMKINRNLLFFISYRLLKLAVQKTKKNVSLKHHNICRLGIIFSL